MKKILYSLLAIALATVAQAQTQTSVADNVVKYDMGEFNLHVFTSKEAMADISIIVEGSDGLVILEPQSFYKSIEEFNGYIAQLDKPVEKIVANYHAGGLAECDPKRVVMVEPMVDFMSSPTAEGMMQKFETIFQGAMDTRTIKVEHTIPQESDHQWASIGFHFTKGNISDFPASNVNIGNRVFYTHFSPKKMHPSPMQIKSLEAIDTTLDELKSAKGSGCEIFVGSHGPVASLDDVEFMIEYLARLKELVLECGSSDLLAQRLLVSYPQLEAAENVKAIAKALYPDELPDPQKEAVRARVEDYFNMVSNLDEEIAKGLWASKGDISIITPRSQFFGIDNIMNDFLIKTFSSMQYRKLHSLSEMINIYGDSANVQLYWVFDTVDSSGEKHQTRGRETLIFEKLDGQWRLVHVHYSRMPQ